MTYADERPPSTLKSVPYTSEWSIVAGPFSYQGAGGAYGHVAAIITSHLGKGKGSQHLRDNLEPKTRDAQNKAPFASSTASPNLPIGRCINRRSRFSDVSRKSIRRAVEVVANNEWDEEVNRPAYGFSKDH